MLAGIFLFSYLLWNNLVPSGHFEVVYKFQSNPFISALRPPERLSTIEEQTMSFDRRYKIKAQRVTADPVYFDLHLPSSFERVELDILHEYKDGQKLTIAAFTDRKNWKFITADTELRNPYRDYAEGLSLHANFNTAGLDIVDRTVTFVLGAPEASQENPITIYEIRVVATKSPTRLQEIPAKILKIFKFRIRNS